MRIAVWHNLPSGGGKRALYDHVRGLVTRGHQIEAWCPPTADRSFLPLSEIVPEHVVPLGPDRDWKEDPVTQGIFTRLRWNSMARLKAMESHSRECGQQINSGKFDLLFSAGCFWFHTPFIGRFVNIPSVLYLQEPNRPLYEALPELPWPALNWTAKDLPNLHFWQRALAYRVRLSFKRILAREERRNAAAFGQILVNSFFSRESVLRTFGLDCKVCYLGVDTTKFVNQHKQRDSFAVCVGAVVPPKNVEFLVASVARVPVQIRPKLVLIANTILNPYLDGIRNLAQELQVVLEVRHRIRDSEVVDLLNRARIMIYAPRLEPFGYAPLEANACGLPVIAVAEGGVRETVRDGVNGILVEHDPESMAGVIKRLLSDGDLHARLSAQADSLARTFWSMEPSIDRLEQNLKRHVRNIPEQPVELREDSVLFTPR